MWNITSIKRSFMLSTAVIAIIVSTAIPYTSHAYVNNGVKWSSYPVNVDVSDASLPFSWISPIANAMSAWNGASSPFYFNSGATGHQMKTSNSGANNTPAYTAVTHSGSVITDCDTYFNTYYSWSTTGASGSFDVQSIATHELGHWLSLGDEYNSTDFYNTMYYATGTGEIWKRSLESDDLSGINAIYP